MARETRQEQDERTRKRTQDWGMRDGTVARCSLGFFYTAREVATWYGVCYLVRLPTQRRGQEDSDERARVILLATGILALRDNEGKGNTPSTDEGGASLRGQVCRARRWRGDEEVGAVPVPLSLRSDTQIVTLIYFGSTTSTIAPRLMIQTRHKRKQKLR